MGGARRLADEIAESRAARARFEAMIARNAEPDRTRWMAYMESVYGREVPMEPFVGPVIGWKAWLLDGDLLVDHPGIGWEGPVMTTDPERPSYRRLFSEDELAEQIPVAITSFKNAGSGPSIAPVLGRVDNFGLVVEHDFGWRAERAIVRELWLTPFFPAAGEAARGPLEVRYGCPVRILSWSDYAERIDKYAPYGLGEAVRELHVEPEHALAPAGPDRPV